MYPWPLVKRVKRCWDTIKNWLINNFPEAAATLCKGASEAEIQELENTLEVKLPLPTRILYRFYNGQKIMKKAPTPSEFGSLLGLIGGYSFSTYFTNVYLLPISEVIQETMEITSRLGCFRRSKYVLVAASSTHSEKLFFLNCTDGQLYVETSNLFVDEDLVPCVPQDLISLGHEENIEQQQDAMLLWLEEHGRRLQHGFIKLEEGNIRSINLFPEEPALCSTAVINGMQVRASASLMPEFTDIQDDEKYLFAYSIRVSVDSQGCLTNGMCISSCEILWWHWIIDGDDIEQEIELYDFSGPGKFPPFRVGDKEFVFRSYVRLSTLSGSINGSLTFIPGSMEEPEGGHFGVTVPLFPLEVADYIF